MRLIDADLLRSTEQTGKVFSEECDELYGILQLIDEQPTIEQPQWIPRSERLPLEEVVYIVSCVNHNGCEFVSDDYFYPSESNIEGGFFDAFGAYVIAWQPLPQNYKEESK